MQPAPPDDPEQPSAATQPSEALQPSDTLQPSAAMQPSALSAEMTVAAFWELLRDRIDTDSGTKVKLIIDETKRKFGIDDSALDSALGALENRVTTLEGT